jgi:hypothetical protein
VRSFPVALVFVAAACGGAPAHPEVAAPPSETANANAAASANAGADTNAKPDADAHPKADAEANAKPAELPSTCSGEPCTPPADFVDRLCARTFIDTTLALFAKGTPWTRAYLRGNVDGWYTGGPSTRAKLLLDEEVLVLRFRAPNKGGMVIEGQSGGYDVLRWDGNCYTLEAGEVTQKKPPHAKFTAPAWNRIGARMQDALLKNETIKRAYDKRNKECQGATSGDVSRACEKADGALGAAIIEYVRTTGELPKPDRLP